ncbi:MAG TPA: radical SAM protein [Atribacterota bacterium]|nr:radical SAM protein [Atribacterota bacterium]
MAINFKFAKKFAAEQVLKQTFHYLEKDPEKNFIKILNLADKIARTEKHHNDIAAIKKSYETNPAIRELVRKITKIAPSYKEGMIMNFFVNSGLMGVARQLEAKQELGAWVPWTILIDPTSACNLSCTGCWAGKYKKSDTLTFSTINRIITEAKELGIYFIVLSGGEPTLYPQLFDIFNSHPDVGFMMYTNGTMIDDKMADKMVEAGNISPAISLEGFRESTDARRGAGTYERIMAAMDRLRERGVIFGISLTITKQNADELFATDSFIDYMVTKGAIYGWSFHYIPIGKDTNLDMMITPEQRAMLAYRIPEMRTTKPIFLVDFWNDGTYSGGCIAGGRRYFHINAKGEVEPCAFVHFAVDNIKNKSLKEALQNPLFKSFQKRQPFNENLMAPCPIIDNPQKLRDIVAESGAYPTHDGAETVITGPIAKFLDRLSSNWHKKSKPIFDERMKNGQKAKLPLEIREREQTGEKTA